MPRSLRHTALLPLTLVLLLLAWGCESSPEAITQQSEVVSPTPEAPANTAEVSPAASNTPEAPAAQPEGPTHDPEKGCIELKPPHVALSDAIAYLDEGKPERAIEECKEGLQGGEKGCHEVLSRAYIALEDDELTCYHVREALKVTPEDAALKARALEYQCIEHDAPY